MADVAISTVLKKVVEIIANVVVEECSRLRLLREDIRWLERQLGHMQAYLEDAEAKKVTNPKVATLIKDIRDLAHDVEDLFDTYLPQIQGHRSSGFLKRTVHIGSYGRACSAFSKKIEPIKKRVGGIENDRKIYGIEVTNQREVDESNPDPRTTTLHFEDHIIVGFDRCTGELKKKLEKHQFVSIVGMGGLGKTTLAKKVFKSVKNDFDCSASVSISQNPNIKALLRDIATQVGLTEEKMREKLESNLYSFLQEKKYVLFLDDIWHTEAWDSLKECFPIVPESASRIIVTSRDTGVGRYIGGEESLYELHAFDERTSWELFSKLVTFAFGNCNESFEHSELREIGQKIVEKCGGIPLAIVVTVGMLRERGMREFGWNEVLKSIGQDAHDKCSQILGLSYMDLPTALKPCFLYFGIFPEDYVFSASKLIRMWVGEKFVEGIAARDVEDVGMGYISKLDSRNLILVVERGLDGRVKKFRVHDLLYSLCISKGREIGFLDTIDHLDPTSAKKVRRLGAFGDEDILKCDMPKIRGLFHFKFEERKQPKHLKTTLNKSILLRVLTFQTTLFPFHLPKSVGSLSYLNYLHIKSPYEYVEIPLSIQNLKYLETLIVHCSWVEIPIGIWKMEQLKHLNLKARCLYYHKCDYYLQLLRGLKDQVSLPNIQTLSLPQVHHPKYSHILAKQVRHQKYSHILAKLTTLRKLSTVNVTREMMEVLCGREPILNNLETLHCLYCRDECGGMRMNLSKYGMLTELKITDLYHFDLQDHDLPPSLIKVTLGNCQILYSTMEILKKLPKLKILELYGIISGSKMDCSGGFLQLEVLKLYSLPRLEELIEGEGEEMGMPKLRHLIIENCGELPTIPERLQHLRAQTN